jgi:hypothetical protein
MVFARSVQTNARTVPRLSHDRSFPINHSAIILLFGTVHSEKLSTASANRTVTALLSSNQLDPSGD